MKRIISLIVFLSVFFTMKQNVSAQIINKTPNSTLKVEQKFSTTLIQSSLKTYQDSIDFLLTLINKNLSGLDSLTSSKEMAMIHLQSIVSQRSTLLQLTTNMISRLDSAIHSISRNIGH